MADACDVGGLVGAGCGRIKLPGSCGAVARHMRRKATLGERGESGVVGKLPTICRRGALGAEIWPKFAVGVAIRPNLAKLGRLGPNPANIPPTSAKHWSSSCWSNLAQIWSHVGLVWPLVLEFGQHAAKLGNLSASVTRSWLIFDQQYWATCASSAPKNIWPIIRGHKKRADP